MGGAGGGAPPRPPRGVLERGNKGLNRPRVAGGAAPAPRPGRPAGPPGDRRPHPRRPGARAAGLWLALKGSGGREEAAAGAQAVALCGGAIQEIKDYSLPNGDKRTLIIIEKVLATPPRYPRPPQKIKKEGPQPSPALRA